MGLAERRRVAAIASELAPKYQQEFKEAVGFDLPFEVAIDSLPADKTVLDCWDYYHESYGPGLVVKVFKDLCKDDLGKEAVQEKIEKVVFRNAAKSAEDPGDKSLALEGKTLVITASFYGYSDKLYGESDLLSQLEAML